MNPVVRHLLMAKRKPGFSKAGPLAYHQGLNLVVNSSVVADANGFYTVEVTFQAESSFTELGIILPHYGSSSINVARAAVAPSAVLSTAWSGLTPVNLTFGGSEGITLPARIGTNIPSMTYSDMVPASSLARTDGGSGFLYRMRVVYSGASSVAMPFSYNASQETGAAYKAATGHDWWGAGAAGDGVTSPSLATTGILTNARPVAGYITSGQGITHAAFGDSVTAGQQQSLASARGAVLQMAQSLSTSAAPHVALNFGWNGSSSQQYYERALGIFNDYDARKIDFSWCWFLVSSQNDSDTIASRKARALEIVYRCLARRIMPVLVSPVPLNGATAGVQAAILEMRLWAQDTAAKFNIPWVDQYLALGYEDMTTVGYRTDFGTGGHPNEAGQQALGAAWAAAAQPYFT